MRHQLIPTKDILKIVFWSHCLVCLIALVFICRYADIPLFQLLKIFSDLLYNPGYNIFHVMQLGSMHPMKMICLALYGSILISTFIFKIVHRLSFESMIQILPDITRITVVFAIATLALSDMAMRIADVREDIHLYSGKSIVDRNAIIFGVPYQFAISACQQLEGRHTADIETDIVFSEDSHLTRRAILLFHMYPTVNLYHNVRAPADIRLYYHIRNVDERIPANETVVTRSPEGMFVLTAEKPNTK
ncbi:MAG: hypothetical protein H6756_08040 [Candidatus Omnitrophica bacterium]|nr:hypothetical protein [Candidatus Omnitrophota bacterium]